MLSSGGGCLLVHEDIEFDNTLSPDDQVTFSGADPAAGSANHTTSGRGRGRNAPPYSYASAISSARIGSQNPTSANTAIPLNYSPYLGPAPGGNDTAWASTSGSGSGSLNSSEGLSGIPFGSSNIVPTPQLLMQQYGQVESHASFMLPQESPPYAQAPLNLPSNPIWGDDFGFDDSGDAGAMAGFSFSPVSGVSHSGSYVDDSPESAEMSGRSTEVNFNGTAGLANYASASISSAPVSPGSPRGQHDNKRIKRSGTIEEYGADVIVATDTRRDSISTSASSSGRGGGKGKQKRELRSASRTSKNKQERVAETTEEQRSRNSHNLVEKQYRNRLNAQFEDLLHALPESSWSTGPSLDDDDGDGRAKMGEKKRVSKAEVLDLARQRIMFLEAENRKIERENDDLRRGSAG
ncbi:hypothetical protein BR93DRAFT_935728 [Coniochaeta sp. PMI_546]|nr:hypothetical protein BR93DRAFT_935728 [Coniochaeta sp. PMI_546]